MYTQIAPTRGKVAYTCGVLREVLLGLLDVESRHGYGLKTAFEDLLGGTWPLNIGQIYTTLGRAERDGLVRSEVVDTGRLPLRKVYTLTDDGRHEVEAWVRSPDSAPLNLRDEFFMKIAVASLLEGQAIGGLLTRQRDAHISALAALRDARRNTGLHPATRLLLEAAQRRLTADIHWLQTCRDQIKSTDAEPEHHLETPAAGSRQPAGAKDRRSGPLGHVVLGLIAVEPLYGDELKGSFERFLGGTWPIDSGQISFTLRKLERDGLIESQLDGDDEKARKVYSATDAGHAELESWTTTPDEGPISLRDEFFQKIAVASLSGGPRVTELVRAQREVHLARMRGLCEATRDPNVHPATALLLDAARHRLEADIDWLDYCDKATSNR
jgi:DNA-binding PadR family transcriptional regulator